MWAGKAAVPTAKNIVRKMEENLSRRKYELKESTFLNSDSQVLRELEMEQISLVLWAALVIQKYALKDGRIKELFLHLVCDRDYPVSLIHGAQFLHVVVYSNSRGKAQMSYGTRVTTAFGAQLYL